MKKAGILGGGQLGRMLLQASANYPVETFVMEAQEDCPAAHLCHHFVKGDISDFDHVYNFGKGLDVITIEIEKVNTDALEKLASEGVKVFPSPAALKIIRDKILQKEFYKASDVPSSAFVTTQNIEELKLHEAFLPAVHKLARGGYDGKGVQLIETGTDADKGFNEPAVLEKKVNITKEIAVLIAVAQNGELALYPPVHMVFDKSLNMLSHQVSPADLEEKELWKAEAIALRVVKALKSPGLFAIEMFVDEAGNVLVNETAPRVHNSGHHTIEGNYSSQFDMLWRVMLDYPLGNPQPILSSALVNLVGQPGFSGPPVYEGMEKVLAMDNVFVHIYGKTTTSPGRKMGHVTILSNEKQELVHKVSQIKHCFLVKA